MKALDKTPEKDLNEMEISNLPDRVKVMVIKMVTKLGTRMDSHNGAFNNKRKNKKAPNRSYRTDEYNY